MKVRKKDLCHTCRKRKLQCDGKLPACSQCLNSKRNCEGYPEALFVPYEAPKSAIKAENADKLLASQSGSAFKSFASDSTSGSGKFKDTPSISHTMPGLHKRSSFIPHLGFTSLVTTQDSILIILRNYVPLSGTGFETTRSHIQSPQVCGSWVMALPELTIDTIGPHVECLKSALNTLALSITAYRNRTDMLDSVSTHYEHSLHLLAQSLAETRSAYRNELVAVVMCLALVEVLSPIRPTSWLVHVGGVSKMFQLSSPELFASGVEHTLFIGFRPLLILKAFILRKATFLAENAWVEMPFQHHHAVSLQSLLGVAASIPEILEGVDVSINDPCTATTENARERITELIDAQARLAAWHCSCLESALTPLYWRRTIEAEVESNSDLLWFQDLSTCNAFIYFWAFQLICLTTTQTLLERYPELEHLLYNTIYDAKELRKICLELSIKIYQSMEYILQEDFMLYGISSAGFPLQTACRTLALDAEGRTMLQSLDHTIITRSMIQNV